MAHFFEGCALGAVIIAAIGAPLLAPWPLRVRYLATAQTVDPLLGLGANFRFETRAVTVASVDADRGRVQLVLAEVGCGPATRATTVGRAGCAPSVVAELDGWAALHSPLLMITDEHRVVHLYGPGGAAVTELVVEKERVA